MLARLLETWVDLVARRRVVVAGVFVLLALGGAALALRLEPRAGTDTFVGTSSPSYRANEDYHRKFGDDAVIVLVRQKLADLVLKRGQLEHLIGLEGCIAGNAPKDLKEFPGGKDGPCARFAKTKPAQIVVGPGTFVNQAVTQVSDGFFSELQRLQTEPQAAGEAAEKLARENGYSKKKAKELGAQASQLRSYQLVAQLADLGQKYGLSRPPTLDDVTFLSNLVFAKSTTSTPKPKFAYLFPNADSALINVRLKPGLSDDQRHDAIALIRRAVAMPNWKLDGGTYTVSGAPVVLSDLTSSITDSIVLLLVAALVVMALTLLLVFRARARLLPLAMALGAAGLTFGGLSLAGMSLTMASIAVLPVLLGLAVDYAIQYQSRVEEAGGDVRRAAALGGPTILTAGAATAAGFLVLLLSPVPMVRGFGLLLVIGIALAFVTTFSAGAALLARRPPRRRPGLGAVGAALGAAVRGADELVAGNRAARAAGRRLGGWSSRALRTAVDRPLPFLGVALALAVGGWVLDTHTKVESDVTKLVPPNLRALRDLDTLERATGVGGQIDVVVTSDRITDPKVVNWMTSYQSGLLRQFGYTDASGCGTAELCPAFSLPDLFEREPVKDGKAVEDLLGVLPPYFSAGVVTKDRKTATLAFGIRLMPLEEQSRVVEKMRRALKPPQGVKAELAGLPVLAADANAKLSSPWRRALQLVAGLLAVALVLLAAFRTWRRALVPLVPIALATGWSALLLFAMRIPLNPMSATLGALVIAISTEFSVLLSERYRQERLAGHSVTAALERTYASTGRAVVASGVTAIAGFAVLTVSDIRMLRDFGLVTVVDLTVSLLGVLIVLPAALRVFGDGIRVPFAWRPRRRAKLWPRRGVA